MKIVCYVADHGGCGFYRIILPYSNLKGHEVRIRQGVITPDLYWCDVAVFQRVDNDDVIARMREAKNIGKKVILDCDDNLHNLPITNPCSAIFGEGKPATVRFEKALQTADLVTVSTQGLADEYRRFNPNIKVCENFVSDKHVYLIAPKEITGELKRPPEVRIGYVGSPTHAGDVASISQPLVNIAKKYPNVKYVFFGQPPQLPHTLDHRVEYHPAICALAKESASDFMLRYYQAVVALDLDIAIAPLKANAFNRCKSAVKMLELGMCGIPIVASRFGPYEDWPLVERGWVGSLEYFIGMRMARRTFAEANLSFIRRYFTTPTAIKQWEAILNAL